jgi:hypothetical protein
VLSICLARNSPGRLAPGAWGCAATLRAPGDAHTKSTATPSIYTQLLKPVLLAHGPPRASPELRRRRCPIPQQRSHQHRRTSVDCPQIRRPAPRLPEAEAPTQPNPCIPRVRTPEEEEEEGGAAARRPPRRSLRDEGSEAVGPRAAGGACRVYDVPALPGTSQGGHRHSPVPPHM